VQAFEISVVSITLFDFLLASLYLFVWVPQLFI
jgi:hypothetical protein